MRDFLLMKPLLIYMRGTTDYLIIAQSVVTAAQSAATVHSIYSYLHRMTDDAQSAATVHF